jgi:hypothetical protein
MSCPRTARLSKISFHQPVRSTPKPKSDFASHAATTDQSKWKQQITIIGQARRAAAIAARAGVKPVMFAGGRRSSTPVAPGGQLMIMSRTTGRAQPVQAEHFQKQAERFGTAAT